MNPYDDPVFFAEYAKMARSQHGLEGAGEWGQLCHLLPEMAGLRVLDLGCGYGWHCRYGAQQGAASVLGIDQSEKMIQRARQINAHDAITYRVQGLEEFDYPELTFDLVISNLVLHYVEDLEGLYRRVHRTLRREGDFVFNIEHPVFTAGVNQQFSPDGTWPVSDYFYPGPRQTNFLGQTITKQHHTLTQILMGLRKTGFQIDTVEEVMPPESWREAMPEEMRRPMMLLVKARREG